MCNLHFSYRPINIQRPIRQTVSEVAKLGVNVSPAAVYSDFETAIHNSVTTVWPGLEVKACRFHLGQLVEGNANFGTQQAVWKERL